MTLENVQLEHVEFVQPCPIQYRCRRCSGLDITLKKSRCGHGFCTRCVDLVRAARFQCPIDSRSVEKKELHEDQDVKDKILEFSVYCLQNKRGCKRTLLLKNLEPHLESCGYVPVCCPCACGMQILKRELAQHLISSCEHRLIVCPHCQEELYYKDSGVHNKVCRMMLVPCPLCKTEIEREQLPNHGDSCPMQPKHCIFFQSGCSFKGAKSELEQHEADVQKHQFIMAESLIRWQLHVKSLEERLSETTLENTQLKQQIQDIYPLLETVKGVDKRVAALQEKVKKLEIAETTVEEMNETLVRLREYMQRVQPAVVQDHESPQGAKTPKSRSPLRGMFGTSYDEQKVKHTAPPTDL